MCLHIKTAFVLSLSLSLYLNWVHCVRSARSRIFSLTKLIISMSIDDLSRDAKAIPSMHSSSSLIYTNFYLHLQLIYLGMHAKEKKNTWVLTWVCIYARFLRAYPKNQQNISHTHTCRPISRCRSIVATSSIKDQTKMDFFYVTFRFTLSPRHTSLCLIPSARLISFAIYLFALLVCLFASRFRSGWYFSLFHLDVCFVYRCILDTWIHLCLCKISIKTGLSAWSLSTGL